MRKQLIELDAQLDMKRDEEGVPAENVEQQCRVLQMLLCSKVTTFQFPLGLSSENEAAATKLWQSLVAERPPDLHTIIRKCGKGVVDPWAIEPFFDSMLKSFPNLETLKLDRFTCNNAHLYSIASHLPKLRCDPCAFFILLYIWRAL